MTEKIYKRMAVGAAWMTLFTMANRLQGLVSTVILARLLVPEDFGIIAMAMSMIAGVELLTAVGLEIVLIQHPDPKDYHFRSAFTANVFLGFVAANRWKPRFFCRFVCPLGAMLGVFAAKSLFRINRIVDRCTDCNLCLMRCEGASDPHSLVRQAECFACMNCIDDCPENALEFTICP